MVIPSVCVLSSEQSPAPAKRRPATNRPRANPAEPPADKAFEKFTPRELIPYVMANKALNDYEGPDGMRLACAWFCWKTRGKGGRELRKALADSIVAMLAAIKDDPKRSLHGCSVQAGFLGPLGAREDIRKLLTGIRSRGLDCCYGPALVKGLAECGDLRDVPFLIDSVIDKESECCAPIVHDVLVKLTGRRDAPRPKGYTSKAAWQNWWRENGKRLLRSTTRPAGQTDKRAIEALLALLKLGMPADWKACQIRKGRVAPIYWREGQGVHINLLPKAAAKRVDAKPDGVHLWVMSPQYWAHPPKNKGNRQTIRARQIAFWRGRRVFIWGDPGKAWPPRKYIGVVRRALASSSGIPGALAVLSDRPGTYVAGKWKYVLARTPSYRPGLRGSLQYGGKGVAGARYVRTPWGEMQCKPSRRDMSGQSGWMLTVVEAPVRKEFFNAGADGGKTPAGPGTR